MVAGTRATSAVELTEVQLSRSELTILAFVVGRRLFWLFLRDLIGTGIWLPTSLSMEMESADNLS